MQETSDYVYHHTVTLPLSSPKEQAALEAVKEVGFYKAVSQFTAKGHDPLNYTLVTHEKIVWRTEVVIDFQAANRLVFRPYPEKAVDTAPGRHEQHSLTYLGLSLFLANEATHALHGGLIRPAEYMNKYDIPHQICAEFATADWYKPNQAPSVSMRTMTFYRQFYRVSIMYRGAFNGSSGSEFYHLTTFAFERTT